MEYSLELLLEVVGILAMILTGSAYVSFRTKISDFIEDASDLWAMTYACINDVLDGGTFDKARILAIKVKTEEVWAEAEDLAPFVARILSSKSSVVASLANEKKVA